MGKRNSYPWGKAHVSKSEKLEGFEVQLEILGMSEKTSLGNYATIELVEAQLKRITNVMVTCHVHRSTSTHQHSLKHFQYDIQKDSTNHYATINFLGDDPLYSFQTGKFARKEALVKSINTLKNACFSSH